MHISAWRELGQAEIKKLRVSSVADDDVGRLDVPVDHTLGMRGIEGVRQLHANIDDPPRLERPGAEMLLQGVSLNDLHHDERSACILTDVMHRTNVGMVQRGKDFRFAFKTSEAVGFFCKRLRQDLQCYVAVELGIPGSIHLTHTAFTEQTGHFVRANLSTRF